MARYLVLIVFSLVLSFSLMSEVCGNPNENTEIQSSTQKKIKCKKVKKYNDRSSVNRDAPKGWFLAGTHPLEYKAVLDKKKFHSGTQSCCVEFIDENPSGWTTLMQNMSPAPYSGKRLRMKFWTSTEDVGYVSGWMRVDGRNRKVLSFENMCDRKLKGTNDWFKQEIVLDVPEGSANIGFGVILSGSGKMWVDEISFETVGTDVPTTSCPCSPKLPSEKKPVNLDFEAAD